MKTDKEKLLARLTSKRTSMPEQSINNRLAEEMEIPLNFKQISMTPDISRNNSPVNQRISKLTTPNDEKNNNSPIADIKTSNSRLI
jgi:hypothetical protein